MLNLRQDFPILWLLSFSPLIPRTLMHHIAAQYDERAAIPQRVHGLYGQPLWLQAPVCCQPVCDASRRGAYVAQVRFDVDGALVPEGEAVVVDDGERVRWDEG